MQPRQADTAQADRDFDTVHTEPSRRTTAVCGLLAYLGHSLPSKHICATRHKTLDIFEFAQVFCLFPTESSVFPRLFP